MSQTRRLAIVFPVAIVLAASWALGAAGEARAQSVRASTALCDPAKLAVTAWDDCLRKGQADTEKAMDDALAKLKAAIDARKDLSGQQRTLLKRMVGDSNDLWVRYRNHYCQNVVPILAGPKAKIYEENLACIIDLNTPRPAELAGMATPK
ncbi:hypothetical protein SAMN05444161_7708 [Rhizobiales bacterium GAS191]|nr:hypothetical protein SAMN05519103_06993 [Rhizobiales bacterium GAS113]SED54815.1 hypothetical protein SAMN05519104_3784 [Rhizobiales bacterium GAS188]SEE89631.1 hypothetical protein SAMN05444161_7708 [Rhizobiales bacterium GAS191]